MNITKDVFKHLLNKGIDVSQYLLLSYFNTNIDIQDLLKNVRVVATVSVLEKKGYLVKLGNNLYNLTQKGKDLFEKVTVQPDKIDEKVSVKTDWIEQLHTEIEELIKKNTGSKNFTNPSGKKLNSSVTELNVRFASFFKKYGFQDITKIKNSILKYVNDATTGKIKYPIRIIYYIWNEKNGSVVSEMMDNFDDEIETEEIKKSINTKSLF